MEHTIEQANKQLGTNYSRWYEISSHNYLTEDFIREFADELDWHAISEYQHLSEPFIREFKNQVNWLRISIYQDLSESFIREFKNNVYWTSISRFQKLGVEFAHEFKEKIDFEYFFKNTNIDDCVKEQILTELQSLIDKTFIRDNIRFFAKHLNW